MFETDIDICMYTWVKTTFRCRKIPPCQAKCPVSKTKKTSKTSGC